MKRARAAVLAIVALAAVAVVIAVWPVEVPSPSEGIEASARPGEPVVVMHRTLGAIELRHAPESTLVHDYGGFSLLRATPATTRWLDSEGFEWWAVDGAISHGNHSWDPARDANPVPPDLRSATTPYRIVQFDGPIAPEFVREADELGTVVGVTGGHSILASLSDEAVRRLRAATPVRHVEPFHPGLKLPPGIEGVTADADYAVVVPPGLLPPVEERLRRQAELVVYCAMADHPSHPFLAVRASPTAIRDVARLEDVIAIERVFPIDLHDWATVRLTQANASAAPASLEAFAHGLDGTGETITTTDSGFSLGADGRPTNENFLDRDRPASTRVVVTDVLGPCTLAGIPSGHGLFTSAIATADRPPVGVFDRDAVLDRSDGHAFGARPHWQRFSNQTRSLPLDPTAFLSNAHEGVGARVQYFSWGYDGYGGRVPAYGLASAMIDDYVWKHPSHVLVVSAGNEGAAGMGTVAAAKNAITVGASNETGPLGGEEMAYPLLETTQYGPHVWDHFSSWGNNVERTKPLLVAPGASTCSAHQVNQYSCEAGTSFSTPSVAGEAALVRQYFRDGFHPTGERSGRGFEPSAALVKAVLVSGAHEIRASYGVTPDGAPHAGLNLSGYPNFITGYGRLVTAGALYFADEAGYRGGTAPRKLIVEDRLVARAGEPVTIRFRVTDARVPLNVTLAWTDCPATPGALVAICSDLNLRVTSPSGDVYAGNWFDPVATGESRRVGRAAGLVHDLRNVEESVRLARPSEGEWEARVWPYQVPALPGSPEAIEFAIAITGAVQRP